MLLANWDFIAFVVNKISDSYLPTLFALTSAVNAFHFFYPPFL